MNAKADGPHRPLIPQLGERALIVGQTGSGKTALAHWILKRVEAAPSIIYDTKEEPKFETLRPHRIVESIGDMIEGVHDESIDYLIVRPPLDVVANPEALDSYLRAHYENLRGVPAYIDEGYTFHKNGQAGPGLIGLLTRGRSRGITTMIGSQRPAWISRFCVTESQRFFLCRLSDASDKKRISDVIPNFAELENPPKFGFWYFEAGEDAPTKYGPVKLDSALDVGYTDPATDTPEATGDPAESPQPRRGNWI